MPTTEQHLAQARRNEAFLGTFDLADPRYLDWAVTVIFYAALHYLRALMSKHRYTNISRYGDMDMAFERLTVLKRNPQIYDAYRDLKDDSRSARYDKQWASACTKAGVHRLVHDFRRTVCRDGVEAGNDVFAVMALTGHRSLTTFRRYNIIDTRRVAAAMKRTEAYRAGRLADTARTVTSLGTIGG